MRTVEGYTLREISSEYNIPYGTLGGRYFPGITLKEITREGTPHNKEYRMEVAMDCGKRLLRLMDERNITMKQVCDRTGIPKSTIQHFIYCSNDLSSMRLAKVCGVVGCSMDYVMGLRVTP